MKMKIGSSKVYMRSWKIKDRPTTHFSGAAKQRPAELFVMCKIELSANDKKYKQQCLSHYAMAILALTN